MSDRRQLTVAQESWRETLLDRYFKRDRLKPHTLWNNLANNIASPFVSFNIASSGASNLLLGYVQAISNLATGITQLIGGRFADKTGRRVQITILSSVVTGLFWLLAALYQTPTFLAISFTIITLALGIYSAGWTSIVGEASEGTGKGVFLATFATLASLGGLLALVLTTILTAIYPSYTLLYLLSGGFFLFSALVLKGRKEQNVQRNTKPSELKNNRDLRIYYLVSGVYGVFWGFGWPLFTITIVKIVRVSLFQYSLAQMIGVGATIAFQPFIGRLVDNNRRAGVFWGRMGLVIYPLAYMIMSAPWQYYLLSAFSGITNSLLNIAFVAYLYDISPAGERGRYTAEFGLITGVSTMAGSLLAASALTILATSYTLWLSLAILYSVAAVGRVAAALLHLRLPGSYGSILFHHQASSTA